MAEGWAVEVGASVSRPSRDRQPGGGAHGGQEVSVAGRSARALWFTAARQAELREEAVREPEGTEVCVRAIVSLVSAGTEMLIYRGEGPTDDDLGLETCEGSFSFPIKYAYQVVGEVVAAEARLVRGWH